MNDEDLIQIGDNIYVIYITQLENKDYRYRVTNSAGQCVEFVTGIFYKDTTNNKQYWSVTLSVNKKSKGYEYGKITGKSGIESLLISKEILRYHVKHIVGNPINRRYNNIVVIWGDDKRRMNTYERGLRNLGFKYGRFNWKGWFDTGKCLYKLYPQQIK